MTEAPASIPAEAASTRKPFYGWYVLTTTAALCFFAAVTSQLFTGTMVPSIEEETNWSRSSITLAITLGGMAGGFLSPLFGRLVDKHGPRLLSSAGLIVVVLCVGAMALSREVHIALFYAGYIGGRAVSQNTMAGIVARTTAVNWFRRMRGRAVGIISMAVPLGGAALIPVAQLLLEGGLQWWGVYYAFAVFMLLFLLPPTVLVLRRRPEDMGLLPDGDAHTQRRADQVASVPLREEVDWTLSQALRTRTLWLLIAATSIGVCANGAIGFHQFPYYDDKGISETAAATALSVYALSGALANGLWGFLVERISERVIGAATVALAGGLCLFLLTVDSPAEAIVFAVLFGLLARGEGSIIAMMEASYFGRGSYGAISGFASPFQQIALAFGPSLAALLYEATGSSYSLAFTLFAFMYVASAGLIWMARRPSLPLGR